MVAPIDCLVLLVWWPFVTNNWLKDCQKLCLWNACLFVDVLLVGYLEDRNLPPNQCDVVSECVRAILCNELNDIFVWKNCDGKSLMLSLSSKLSLCSKIAFSEAFCGPFSCWIEVLTKIWGSGLWLFRDTFSNFTTKVVSQCYFFAFQDWL